MRSPLTMWLAVAVVAALAACQTADPKADTPPPTNTVEARNVALGIALDGKAVSVMTDKLTTNDPAYVSVQLDGRGEAKVRTVWTGHGADGQSSAVQTDTETVQVSGPTRLAFALRKSEANFPGDYEVEVFVNERPVAKKAFRVS